MAADSFKAILDAPGGVFYGGGAQVYLGPIYVDVGASRFEKTGERASVFEGDVFRLGIPDRITMMPVVVTAGYRFPIRERVVPLRGRRVASLKFEENSNFADPDENVSERFTSYHGIARMEYWATRRPFVAGEVRYTSVPEALGAPGIAAEFGESHLGGVAVAVKVSSAAELAAGRRVLVHRRTHAEQIAVAVGVIDPSDGRPELACLHPRQRKRRLTA